MSAHASNVIRYAVCTRRFVDKGDEFSRNETQFILCQAPSKRASPGSIGSASGSTTRAAPTRPLIGPPFESAWEWG